MNCSVGLAESELRFISRFIIKNITREGNVYDVISAKIRETKK